MLLHFWWHSAHTSHSDNVHYHRSRTSFNSTNFPLRPSTEFFCEKFCCCWTMSWDGVWGMVVYLHIVRRSRVEWAANSSILCSFYFDDILCYVLSYTTFLVYLWPLPMLESPEHHVQRTGEIWNYSSSPDHLCGYFFPTLFRFCCWLTCPIYWIVHIPATIQIWKLYNGSRENRK